MLVNELREELAQHLGDPFMELINRDLLMTYINSAARDLINSGWLMPLEHAENVELLSEEYEYDVPASFAYIKEIRIGNRTYSNASPVDTGVDLAAAIADTTTATITVGDASIFAVNDLIQVDDEVFLVTAVNTTTNVLTTERGYYSTTAATHDNGSDVERPNADMEFDEIIPRAYWRLKLQAGGANTTTAARGSRPQVVFNSGYFSFTAGTPLQFVGQRRPDIYSAGADTINAQMESFIRERALSYAARYSVARGRTGLSQAARDALLNSEQFLRRHPQEFRVRPNSTRVPGR